MPEAHALRRTRLRAALAGRDVDALLVTSLVNVRYLTGFTGSNAALLVPTDERYGAVLATDGRYLTQSAEECPDLERLIDRAVGPVLAARAGKDGFGRLAAEAQHTTVEAWDALAEAAPGASLLRSGHLVEALRAVKDEQEIGLLRQACAISVAALQALLPAVKPGRSERDLARDLEERMRDLGAEAPAFDTIVAVGENGALPHHQPTERPLREGELLTIDFGARYHGYHADCTRTFAVGEPAGWQRDLHALVAEAQAAGRESLRPGAEPAAVDRSARDVIAAAGYAQQFVHGLGHGVGLEIHEAPMLSAVATGRLEDRTPVTVEPGVYLPGRGGVRIEDTLVVRPDGPECLTAASRDLLVL